MKNKILLGAIISIKLFAIPDEEINLNQRREESKVNQQERINQSKKSIAEWHSDLQARIEQAKTSKLSDPAKELRDRLGVNENATDIEIRKAYHKIALTTHPDKGGDAEEFKKIDHAYKILTNPEELSKYRMKMRAEAQKNPKQQKNLDSLTKAAEMVKTVDRYIQNIESGKSVDSKALNAALKAQYETFEELSSDTDLNSAIHDWAKSMVKEVREIQEELSSQLTSPSRSTTESARSQKPSTKPTSGRSATPTTDPDSSPIEKAINSGDDKKLSYLYDQAHLAGAGHAQGVIGAINDLVQPIVTRYMDLYGSQDPAKIEQATKYAKELESKLRGKNQKLWEDIKSRIEKSIKKYNDNIKKAKKNLGKDLKGKRTSKAKDDMRSARKSGISEEQMEDELKQAQQAETPEEQAKSKGFWQKIMNFFKKLFKTNQPTDSKPN